MPIKKDGTGKRWVEMEVLLPGTPEEVWLAMATGAGNSAWFTRTTIEERVGGALRFEFGKDMASSGEVTAWEPPRRFGYVEREWSEGAPPVATEITITSRAGSQCVVRMVHSLFATADDWDDQIEGFEGGWPGFFQVLRIYLAHFAGLEGASARAMIAAGDDHLAAWLRLLDRLSLAGANVGERRLSPVRPQPLSGIVEQIHQEPKQRHVIVRADAPSSAVLFAGTHEMGGKVWASAILYCYGDDASARAAASEPLWQAWLEVMFAGKS